MEDILDYLEEILKASVKKNGEIPLTNKHLLNIVKMANRNMEIDSQETEMSGFHPDWD